MDFLSRRIIQTGYKLLFCLSITTQQEQYHNRSDCLAKVFKMINEMGQFSDSVDVLASDTVCPRHGSGSTAEHSNLAHLEYNIATHTYYNRLNSGDKCKKDR